MFYAAMLKKSVKLLNGNTEEVQDSWSNDKPTPQFIIPFEDSFQQ